MRRALRTCGRLRRLGITPMVLAAAAAVPLLSAGCGQKGPLVLPEPPPELPAQPDPERDEQDAPDDGS